MVETIIVGGQILDWRGFIDFAVPTPFGLMQ